jgi:hypothetical protein
MDKKKGDMTKDELRALREPGAQFVSNAMVTLGDAWGLGRPLTNAEMGRALKLSDKRWAGSHIHKLVNADATLTGPIEVAIAMMLDGAVPPTMKDVVKPGYPRLHREP